MARIKDVQLSPTMNSKQAANAVTEYVDLSYTRTGKAAPVTKDHIETAVLNTDAWLEANLDAFIAQLPADFKNATTRDEQRCMLDCTAGSRRG